MEQYSKTKELRKGNGKTGWGGERASNTGRREEDGKHQEYFKK